MSTIDLDVLIAASLAGGSTSLASTTELAPAAGPQASVAPAKFAKRGADGGVYAYEQRYLEGAPATAVIIDSKQSQLNRAEAALAQAIADDHPVLSRLPRVQVTYGSHDEAKVLSDLQLPHRAFDAHIRAGTIDGTPVTQTTEYQALRNSNPLDARALLDASPISLVFGSWDSSRVSRQGRWRSVLVGEIIGFCADDKPAYKGGARTDPVGMRIELDSSVLQEIAERQRGELSPVLINKVKSAKPASKTGSGKISASMLGLGGIPPSLEALAGVACHRIVRSHVLSFATLRQIRFGAGADGDAACRALLAALALNALARSDAELVLRANCDLIESGPTAVEIDQRGGDRKALDPLTIEAADALLADALGHAERAAGIRWSGVTLSVVGDPAILAAAGDEEDEDAP